MRINQDAVRRGPKSVLHKYAFLSPFPSWFPLDSLFIASLHLENSTNNPGERGSWGVMML